MKPYVTLLLHDPFATAEHLVSSITDLCLVALSDANLCSLMKRRFAKWESIDNMSFRS